MNVELARFQHGDGVFHIKALAFACPKMRSLGSRVFNSTCIVPDSAAVLRGLLTKWPIMAFCCIRQAYHPPLLVCSINLYSRHSARLDGAGKRRSCQNHPVDQRSPKGPSSQTSWTTSISGGSAPTYRTYLIGWSRETPLLPKSSCGPKVSKRSIFADLLNNIHFRRLSTNLQNSEDLQSPPLAQLCTTTHPWLICQKAFRLACWLAEQGLA